ncbi:hypothetical protein ACFRNJ_36725 [Streptomyces sp. NPDC056721]|uniref:hypothetical protein n=1 Tax=Streptomyces sp. NPDC056721 TaxID=3345923 RepID=UPI003689F746
MEAGLRASARGCVPDPTRAHIDEFSSVSQKALYDTALEAVVAAIERAAGGS